MRRWVRVYDKVTKISIFAMVAVVLLLLAYCGARLAIGDGRPYAIDVDEWVEFSGYHMLKAERKLGNDHYKIEGLDENEWLFATGKSAFPQGVIRRCQNTSQPILEAPIDKIYIANDTASYTDGPAYWVVAILTNPEVVAGVVDAIRDPNIVYDLNGTIERTEYMVLVGFTQMPGLVWQAELFFNEQGEAFLHTASQTNTDGDWFFYALGKQLSQFHDRQRP